MVASVPLSNNENSRLGLPAKSRPIFFATDYALLHGDRGQTRQPFPFSSLSAAKIADRQNFRMAGNAEVWRDKHPARAIHGNAKFFAQRRCRHASSPQGNRCWHTCFTHVNSPGLDPRNQRRSMDFHAQALKLLLRALLTYLPRRREYARAAFQQDDACAFGVNGMEFVGQHFVRDFSERARELNAGWPATDNHEIQLHLAFAICSTAFGEFECQQYAAPDLNRIFHRL